MNKRIAEFRELPDDELLTRLAETKQELFNLRFQHVTGQLDNYARLRDVKHDIARVEGAGVRPASCAVAGSCG